MTIFACRDVVNSVKSCTKLSSLNYGAIFSDGISTVFCRPLQSHGLFCINPRNVTNLCDKIDRTTRNITWHSVNYNFSHTNERSQILHTRQREYFTLYSYRKYVNCFSPDLCEVGQVQLRGANFFGVVSADNVSWPQPKNIVRYFL